MMETKPPQNETHPNSAVVVNDYLPDDSVVYYI